MLDLSSYLDKFKSFQNPNDKKSKVIALILQTSGIEIKPEEISLKKGILYIKTSSIIKSELFFHKTSLIKFLNQEVDNSIKDIR